MKAAIDKQRLLGEAKRLGETAVIVTHLVLLAWGTFLLFEGVIAQPGISWSDLWVVGLSVPAAWVAADLASGLAHFIADNFGTEATPILGRAFIAPFREHHHDPEAMLGHGFVEKNASSALLSLPLLVWLPIFPPGSPLGCFVGAFCVQLAAWVFVTNEIHAACHSRTAPHLVRWLQSTGVVLAPDRHELHHAEATRHADPSSRGAARFHYCITSGICDRVLSRVFPPRSPIRRASRVR